MNTTESTGSSNSFSGMFAPLASVAANYLQDKMHKKMDTDADGVVGKTEFKDALEKVGAKLGVDSGGNADAMFASVDADGNGSLTGSEVGQMLKNMFSPPANTDAFVQSRGKEQHFAEMDADGDGNISMAEFGINPGGSEGMTMVSTTTTTTTYASSAAQAAAGVANASTAATDEAVAAADTSATAPLNEDALQALLGQVDSDGDGQISGAEISAFVTQLGSQMQAASQKYNDTALASFSTNQLNETA
jgi:Ca2+-binding EF-hand superfamily protein